MSDPDEPPSLKELGARIDKVRQGAGLSSEETAAEGAPPTSELGLAWRISIEIVVDFCVSFLDQTAQGPRETLPPPPPLAYEVFEGLGR